ncbi:uncharacterized protein CDAR_436041 [Caerostris darwini]|uniref:Uncharacterized protein n=1 Tax=Caerostris darwini TaxID=1538125 RepID=A0AAV4SM40_9ARAC|nr:uncharacterized protein CDAR_436041 [Caerostris darwini]
MKVMLTVLYLSIGIHSVAALSGEGVPPTVILNRILRKVKYRQRAEKSKPKNPLQDLALQELVGTRYRPQPPGFEGLPPLPGQSSQALPPPPPLIRPGLRPPIQSMPPLPSGNIMTGVFTSGFAPQAPPQSQPYPQTFYIPIQNLQPPPGVTIRVETGLRGGVLPDVTVTLSPMMTIVEALKQAESKYRSYLGLRGASDEAVISFSRSSIDECFVVRSFNNVASDDRGYWKIIVSDKGQVVYDNICLPSRSEVAVKPGMTITLLYTLT